MKKKGLPEVIVRALISLYHGAKTKVHVESELSEDFYKQICLYQESVLLLLLLYAITMDVITKNAVKGLMNEFSMQMT